MGNKENKSYESSLFLKYHKAKVSNIIVLRDGRLSSCSFDKKIIIYKKNSFQIDEILEGKNSFIFHLQLSNNNIVGVHTNCRTNRLEIYELKNNKYKLCQEIKIDQTIKARKIIEIDAKTFALSFKYIYLQIYRIDESKNYTKILEKEILPSTKYGRLYVLKVNESELVSYSYYLHEIQFLDIKNKFEIIAKISNIEIKEIKNSMFMLNNITLLVFATYKKGNGIYLIDIKNHIVIKQIMKRFSFSSIIKLLNGNFLVGYMDMKGNDETGLAEYKYENEMFFKINSVKEENYLINLCEMKDRKIASLSGNRFSGNKKIKIWSKINNKK